MRNFGGARAASGFVVALLDALQTNQDPVVWLKDVKGGQKVPDAKLLAESHKVQKIAWPDRVLLFDRKPTFINKNVDMILLAGTAVKSDGELLEQPNCYLACGELKGGIDPAGADEHWKTARSALSVSLLFLPPVARSSLSSSSEQLSRKRWQASCLPG